MQDSVYVCPAMKYKFAHEGCIGGMLWDYIVV